MAFKKDVPLRMRGALGSPYSLKMRAVLRYRQIPFQWVPQGSRFDDPPPFPLIPALLPVIPNWARWTEIPTHDMAKRTYHCKHPALPPVQQV